MFNETKLEEIQDFIPLIGLCSFISILLLCCACSKRKRIPNNRALNNLRYQYLTNNETDNNYNQHPQHPQHPHHIQHNTRDFPKINFTDSNNEQPPPYQIITN
jgi:hypothetical protein